jgi:hypothetical protein
MILSFCVGALALRESVASWVKTRLPFPESSPIKLLDLPTLLAVKNTAEVANDSHRREAMYGAYG